jgi:hypothetical protein
MSVGFGTSAMSGAWAKNVSGRLSTREESWMMKKNLRILHRFFFVPPLLRSFVFLLGDIRNLKKPAGRAPL